MVSRFLLIILLLTGGNTSAQDKYLQPGLLAASITYSPSTMLNHPRNNFYVSGFAEYFLDSKFSFRSDTYIYLNGSKDYAYITDGARAYFGIAYHMTRGNWDGYVGLQPGITIMNQKLYQNRPEPSAALRIGTTYYVWKYFHFFANLTYTRSKVNMHDLGTLNTDELIFSAGLGFQIQTKKEN